MSLAVSSQVAAGVKNEKESLINVPDDVFEIFQNASPTIKDKHCSAFNEHPYQEIVRFFTLRNGYLVTTVEWITVMKLRALFKRTSFSENVGSLYGSLGSWLQRKEAKST